MKKFMSTLAMVFMLVMSVSYAHAALLTDWNYTITDVSFSGHNTDLVTQTPGSTGFTWDGGKYNNTLSPETSGHSGSFEFSKPDESVSIAPEDVVNNSTELDTTNSDFSGIKNLATLTFSYEITSSDGEVRFKITYHMPLQTYYDASTGNEYIFYNPANIMTQGATAIPYDNYSYGVTGVGLFVDGVATKSFTIEGTNYTGWIINEETRKYLYDEKGNIIGEKTGDLFGTFDIDAVLSVTNAQVSPDATPTPEPATLLLTGLGLASLAFMRRRKK